MKKLKKVFSAGLSITCVFSLFGCTSRQIMLLHEEVTIEYGGTLKNKKEYLDIQNINKKIIDDIEMSSIPNEDKKDYPAVGQYVISFTYKNEHKNMKVNIIDTTKPQFAKDMKTNFSTYLGKPLDKSLFKANDVSKVNIDIDEAHVNYNQVGQYEAVVRAIDQSGNVETKKIHIQVCQPTIKLSQSSFSLYVHQTQKLQAIIQGQNNQVQYKSSNHNVASVSQDGKVTAKSQGTAFITASANGVETTCKVSVQEKAKKQAILKKKKTTNSIFQDYTKNQTLTTLTKDVLTYINQQRKSRGIKPLQWDNRLNTYAQTRAKEISTLFEHFRPNGHSTLQDVPISCQSAGEIIAGGYQTAVSVVDEGWMNSPSHKSNILDKDFTRCSCGRYGNYWVVIFVG